MDAHNLLKECLRSDEASLPLRSAYTHFLISIGSHKEALAFTSQTLKFERADVYTFCALGWIHYTVAREAKSSAELADRSKQYLRSAEAYERALVLDPKCAMAAQGLAIALAEDTLALKGTAPPVGSAEDLKLKMRLAGQALGVLGRINDSVPDGSTSVNMGHCYFVRGEEEKAIQAVSSTVTTVRCEGLQLMAPVRSRRDEVQGQKRPKSLVPLPDVVCFCQSRLQLLGHGQGLVVRSKGKLCGAKM